MKQVLIQIMAAMMPYMKTPILIGGAVLAIGVLLFVWRLVSGKGPLGLVAWVLIALGGFYLACQGMGQFLGITPTINLGDPRKFEFDTHPFWQFGLAFFVPGIIFLLTAKMRKA